MHDEPTPAVQSPASGNRQSYNVLDLFSGMGGFSLGLERSGMRTGAFCEIDPYCRKVLARHWPGVPIHEDIRRLDGHRYAGAVDIVCGGFPCQDISRAGKQAGITGTESGLWFEYNRLIQEIRPRWVIIENVAALLHRGLGDVLSSLSKIGYDAEWHCIPAFYVGSPQVRDRIWIVAYPMQQGEAGWRPGWLGRRIGGEAEARPDGWRGNPQANVQLWPEPAVDRVAYGIPDGVVRINALGNAVVPQIPELIGRAIIAYERQLEMAA